MTTIASPAATSPAVETTDRPAKARKSGQTPSIPPAETATPPTGETAKAKADPIAPSKVLREAVLALASQRGKGGAGPRSAAMAAVRTLLDFDPSVSIDGSLIATELAGQSANAQTCLAYALSIGPAVTAGAWNRATAKAAKAK